MVFLLTKLVPDLPPSNIDKCQYQNEKISSILIVKCEISNHQYHNWRTLTSSDLLTALASPSPSPLLRCLYVSLRLESAAEVSATLATRVSVSGAEVMARSLPAAATISCTLVTAALLCCSANVNNAHCITKYCQYLLQTIA